MARRESCPPATDVLFTLAKDFSKSEAVKEISDNAVQSTILFFHAQFCARVKRLLREALLELSRVIEACDVGTDTVIGMLAEALSSEHGERFLSLQPGEREFIKSIVQIWVDDLLDVTRVADFVAAVKAQSLGGLACGKISALNQLGSTLPQDMLRDFWAKVTELKECAVERTPKSTQERPMILLKFDLDLRTFECWDNGRGVDEEAVRKMMCTGATGHGHDPSIGPGGRSFATCGSLCSGMFSSYGVGAKAAGLSLSMPDGGSAEEVHGSTRVRSVRLDPKSGERRVVGGRQDIQAMRQTEATANTDFWYFDWEEDEVKGDEIERLDDVEWGERLTRVTIEGLAADFCAKLRSSENERHALVSYFADVYYPLLFNGVLGEPATRPLQCVELHIEFFMGKESPELYTLANHLMRLPCILSPYSTLQAAGTPTIAQLLERHRENVEREKMHHQAQYAALSALFGPELTLRVRMPLPAGLGGKKGETMLVHFLYFPLDANGETSFGSEANGVFFVQNGCRLAKQPCVLWSFMRLPTMRRKEERLRREVLSDGCYGRVTALAFLPPSCAITKNKARLTDDCSTQIEQLDSSVVPVVLGPDEGADGVEGAQRQQRAAGRAAADLISANGRAAAAPGSARGAAPVEPASAHAASPGLPIAPLRELVRMKSLALVYLDVFLKYSRKRDMDVLVSDSEPALRMGNTGNWRFNNLVYMRKELSVGQPGGLWLLHKPCSNAKSAPISLGRVLYFVCKDGKPDPAKASLDSYFMVVERHTLDTRFGVEEQVPFADVDKLADINLSTAAVAKWREQERQKLPSRLLLSWRAEGVGDRSSIRDFDRASATPFEALPKWTSVSVIVQGGRRPDGDKGTLWSQKMPLALELVSDASGEVVRSTDNSAMEMPFASDKHFDMDLDYAHRPVAECLELGAYTLRARVRTGVYKWVDELKIDPVQVPILIVQGTASRAHIVYAKNYEPAELLLLLGHSELPPFYVVATDKRGRIVDVNGELVPRAMAVAERRASHELALRNSIAIVAKSVAPSELLMPGEVRRHALAAQIKVLSVSGLQLAPDAGFQLPIGTGAACAFAPPSTARPYKLKLDLTIKVSAHDTNSLVKVEDAHDGPLLAPGVPAKLSVLENGGGQLAFGSEMPQISVVALDSWDNVVTLAADGHALRLSCSATGVDNLPAHLDACMQGASRGRFIVPHALVCAPFGQTARLTLTLCSEPTFAGNPLSAELTWDVAPRMLAFTLDGAPPALVECTAGGKHVLRVQRLHGSAVDGIRVRVHHVQPDGTLGALDASFSPGSILMMSVHDSAQRSEQKLLVEHGEAAIGWTVLAPRATSTRTLRATIGGASAELQIEGVQGPPAGFKLALVGPAAAARTVRAGEPFTLRATLVDASGADCARAAEQVDLSALRVCALAADGTRLEDPEEVAAWTPVAARTITAAECQLMLRVAGKCSLALEVESMRGLVGAAPSQAHTDAMLVPTPRVDVCVQAGAPVSLHLVSIGAHDDEPPLFLELSSGDQFALAARVRDAHGNACAGDARCTLHVRGDAEAKMHFYVSAKGAQCPSPPAAEASTLTWKKLVLRPAVGETMPAAGAIYARLVLGARVPLCSGDVPIRLLPRQQPHRLQVELVSSVARVHGPMVRVRARVLLDDDDCAPKGRAGCKPFLEAELPARTSTRKASAGADACTFHPLNFEGGWWIFDMHPPSTAGRHVWRVGAAALGTHRADAVVDTAEEATEELDLQQPHLTLTRCDSQETIVPSLPDPNELDDALAPVPLPHLQQDAQPRGETSPPTAHTRCTDASPTSREEGPSEARPTEPSAAGSTRLARQLALPATPRTGGKRLALNDEERAQQAARDELREVEAQALKAIKDHSEAQKKVDEARKLLEAAASKAVELQQLAKAARDFVDKIGRDATALELTGGRMPSPMAHEQEVFIGRVKTRLSLGGSTTPDDERLKRKRPRASMA